MSITFASDGNGTLTGTTSQAVTTGGSTSAVTANSNPGYHFVNWTGTNGFATTTTNPLVVANVTSSMTITAHFVVDLAPSTTTGDTTSVTTASATLNGTVNDNGALTTVTFDYGTTASYGSTASAGNISAGAGETAVSANLTDLTCGTTYHYLVVATNNAGTSYGADKSFITAACVSTVIPSAGAKGSISPNTPQTATNGATIQFIVTPDAGYSASVGGTCDGTLVDTTYTTNTVTADCTVEAAFTDTYPPTNSATFTATAVGSSQIDLSWSAASDSGSGLSVTNPYKLVRATGVSAPADCVGTAVYQGTATSHSDTALTAETQYSYRVCAYDAAGNASSGATTTAATAPQPAPSNLTATEGGGQITLNWTASSGATSYNIYWSTTPGVTKATGTKISAVSATSYAHTGISGKSRFYYVITAINGPNESVDSNQASAFLAGWAYIASPGRYMDLSTEPLNGLLYAVGGEQYGSNCGVSSVKAYDPTSNTWIVKQSMNIARTSPATTVVNGKLYAIGGNSGGDCTTLHSDVEEYTPSTNTWVIRASMSVPRTSVAAATVNGIIYAIGGYATGSNSGPSTLVEAYDPAANTWSTKASLPAATAAATATVVDGIIYVIGSGKVQAYNPDNNTWSTKADMLSNRWRTTTGLVNGQIYVAGGSIDDTESSLATTEVYKPATDTWSTAPSMLTARWQLHGHAALNGRLYAIGGTAGTGTLTSAEQLMLSDIGVPIDISASQGAALNTITWKTVAEATSYNIYWSTRQGISPAFATKIAGITGTSYTHTGLADATRYYYAVSAVTSNGEGFISDEASSITAESASCPVNGSCGISNISNLANAPDTYLCLAGAAGSVSGSGPWGWSCQGANGGTTTFCSSAYNFVVVTDANWKTSADLQSGWTTENFDDSAWGNAYLQHDYFNDTDYGHLSIWGAPEGTPLPVSYFRRTLVLPSAPAAADFTITVDDDYELYVNGILVGSDSDGYAGPKATYSIKDLLHVGTNVIAVKGMDTLGVNHFFDGWLVANSPVLAPVNGLCGTAIADTYSVAPTENLCNPGSPTDVTASGNQWTWTCGGQNGGSDSPTCSAAIQTYPLTLNFSGNGGGSVSDDMSCIKGESCPPVSFIVNTIINLIPNPDSNSLFNGWTDDCTNNEGNCSFTMTGPKTVTATFTEADRVRIGKAPYTTTTPYTTLISAFANVLEVEDEQILARAISFDGPHTITRPVTFKGGFNVDYSANSGSYTILKGKLSIGTSGRLNVQGMKVRALSP